MGSGHTGRSGRSNRRARRGSQRPRGAEGQNGQGQSQSQGQPHANSAMLILSSDVRQSLAHTQRDLPAGDDTTLEEELAPGDVDGDLSMPTDATGTEDVVSDMGRGGAASSPDAEVRPDARHEWHAGHDGGAETHEKHQQHGQHVNGTASTAPGVGRGPHERGQPYAPGVRVQPSQSHQPHRTQPPAVRGPAAERGGALRQGEGGWRDDDIGADDDAGSSDEMRDMPGAWSRPPRAEHGDQHGQHERSERSDRGEHAPFQPEVRGEVGPLIDALHGLFEQDRAIASQGGTTRCGVCYLHFTLADLEYREAEGYYVCRPCARSLGNNRLPMVRRQQRA